MWIRRPGRLPTRCTASDGLSLANPASNGHSLLHALGDHAVYAIIDQMVWHKPNTKVAGYRLFLQIMRAPDDRNVSDLFVEGGLNWKGPLPAVRTMPGRSSSNLCRDRRRRATISARIVFITAAWARPIAQGEPIVEATYRARLTPWLKVQPDLQYVINPGASIPTAQNAAPLKNALVLGVRVTVNF